MSYETILLLRSGINYEIKSDMYSVAALLNVSKLNIWYKRKDCLYIRRSASLNLLKIREIFDKTKEDTQHNNNTQDNSNNSDSDDSLAAFLKDDNYQENIELDSEVKLTHIDNEKIEFFNLIEEKNLQTSSTKIFWMKNKIVLPYLKALAENLLNIPSSAAYIERYYSLCGNVCKTKCGNMGKNQIITRSLLKANMKILNDLNKKFK